MYRAIRQNKKLLKFERGESGARMPLWMLILYPGNLLQNVPIRASEASRA